MEAARVDILLLACAADDLDHGTNNATMLHHRDCSPALLA